MLNANVFFFFVRRLTLESRLINKVPKICDIFSHCRNSFLLFLNGIPVVGALVKMYCISIDKNKIDRIEVYAKSIRRDVMEFCYDNNVECGMSINIFIACVELISFHNKRLHKSEILSLNSRDVFFSPLIQINNLLSLVQSTSILCCACITPLFVRKIENSFFTMFHNHSVMVL